MFRMPQKLLNVVRKCKNCNKEFQVKTSNQQFCTIQCRKVYRLNIRKQRYIQPLAKVDHCLYCNKELKPYGSQKFCNEECRRLYRNKIRNKSGRICNRVVVPETLRKCEYCGKDIPFDREHASTYDKKKYCSRKCCALSFKEKHDSFNGCQKNYGEFKVIISKLDNNKYIWKAFKNDKCVLKCEHEFNTYYECKNDISLAF